MLEQYYWESMNCEANLKDIDPSLEHEIYRVVGTLWVLLGAAGIISMVTTMLE